VGSLKKNAKQQKVVKAPALDNAAQQRLQDALQQKMEAEAAVSLKNLQKELENFSKDLKNVLLGEATTSLTTQLDQSKQLIAQTVQELSQTLSAAGTQAASQLTQEVHQQKELLLEQFEQHMAEVVSNYMVAALGAESAQTDQAAQALRQLEAHKEELRKDLLREA
jgi:hypothetical protein